MAKYTPITDGEKFIAVIINRDFKKEGRWKEGELLENVKGGIHPTLYPIKDLLENELIAKVYGFGIRINSEGYVNAIMDFETHKLRLASDKDIPNLERYPEFSYLKEEC